MGWGSGTRGAPFGGGVFKARGPVRDGFALRPVAPRLFWGAGAGEESGRCPHKRPRETPRRLPSSCLPRPLPSPAPSSFKPRLARVVSVQSRPPPSEEMAEEPEPQVKGARPRPRRAPGGAPRRPPAPPRAALASPRSLSCPLPGWPPRPIARSHSIPFLSGAPSSPGEKVSGEPPVCTDSVTITLTLGNSRDGLGVGVPPSGSGAGPA